MCPRCGVHLLSAPASLPRPGNVFDSRFVLLELIGTGGMAKIYRGLDAVNRTQCAVKVLRVKYSAEERAVSQFFTEARMARRLNHPNIVKVIDFGRTDVGYLYIAMELLEGETLSRLVRREGRLPPDRAVGIFSQIAAALAAAHAQGTIHRDLKPENVFLVKDGGATRVKLLDFGIAQFSGTTGAGASREVCGTPAYMSPEQIRGKDAQPESDLYSAGIVLFEMLTGSPPYCGGPPVEILKRQLRAPVPRLREACPDLVVSDELEELVSRLMSKKAENRHRSAARVRSLLVRIPEYAETAMASSEGPAAGTSILLVPPSDHSVDLPVVSYSGRPMCSQERLRILPATSIELADFIDTQVRPGILLEEEQFANRRAGDSGRSLPAEPDSQCVADRYSMMHVRFAPLEGLHDPYRAEELRQAIGAGLEPWFSLVEQRGGVVCYDSGAELKVLFGYMSDAQNFVMDAVQCAAALSVAVEQLSLSGNVGVGVKIGVATGVVYSDGKLDGPLDWLVHGSEVEFAVRLSRVAPVGGVVTCETTALVAQPGADVVALAPLKARGSREVRSFLLKSVEVPDVPTHSLDLELSPPARPAGDSATVN